MDLKCLVPKDPGMSYEKEISPTTLFWGWDSDHPSYSSQTTTSSPAFHKTVQSQWHNFPDSRRIQTFVYWSLPIPGRIIHKIIVNFEWFARKKKRLVWDLNAHPWDNGIFCQMVEFLGSIICKYTLSSHGSVLEFLGNQSPSEKYYAEEFIGHPNHPLTIWLDFYKVGPYQL